ncbi:MAG TPA: hypothetical protein DDZ80_18630 [Cyanobacteria bacterium UBA8803]|nr:hypothetical protein [Cyanobacteria bacterium UBA8803]
MDIEKDSQEAIYRPERAAPGQEETIRKTNPGLNGVQGTANADQMKRPGNSASTSVEEMVGNALEDLKS